MHVYETFKIQLEHLKGVAKDGEFVQVEICGIIGTHLRIIRDSKTGEETLAVHGIDENDMECILVCAAANFFAKLKIVQKKSSKEIGFKITEVKEKF